MANIDNFDFKGKRVFVRVDFNVPLDEAGQITDDTRMRGALPTLRKIVEGGGRLIIGSHMGRPKGVDKKLSLSQLRGHLEELLGRKVEMAEDCVGDAVLKQAQ